jgi:Domain of unknown function (DUF4142)
MCCENRSTVTRILGRWCSTQASTRRWSSALPLLVLLGGSLVACDEFGGDDRRRFGRSGFDRDDDRWGRGWDRRDGRRWRRGHDHDRADASAEGDAGDRGNAATDAGDGGTAINAESTDAAAPAAAGDPLDAGVGADAAPDGGAAALSDAQILQVADNLLAGAIAQAQAALPGLADPDAVAFAEQLIDEDAAARNTLVPVGDAIGASPAGSDIADAVDAESEARVAAFAGPDAGALDELYIELTLAAHAEALELVGELAAAADAPALRAQLVVVQTVLGVQLARAQQLAAAL